MNQKNTIQRWIFALLALIRRRPLIAALLVATIFTLPLFVVLAIGLMPKQVTFAYGSPTCTKTITLLPNSEKLNSTAGFNIVQKGEFRIFGRALFATELCITPTSAPSEKTVTRLKLRLFNVAILAKSVTVKVPDYPTVNRDLTTLKTVSVADPLTLKLSSSDIVFEYILRANNKSTVCQKQQSATLACDPRPLALQHATVYAFSLDRAFDKKPVQTLSSAQIETITPIRIVQTSIADSSIQYDKPKTVTLTTDKPISSVNDISLKQKDGSDITSKVSYSGTSIQITFGAELSRGAAFTLVIGSVLAQDGGSLVSPYELHFSTSKGPKVSNLNIGQSGVSQTTNIVISFDQPILKSQDIGKELQFIIGGKPVPARLSASDASITIDPIDALPKCTSFSIILSANVSNPYGIAGDSAWQYTARTTCFDTFSIGTSAQGRQIIGYRYGNNPNPLVFVGGIHGDEQNAKRLMDKWIAELDANPDKIPVNRSIVIIPSANPDGYAVNQRVNANGKDLNRNFPANNWKATVKEPSGAILAEGGGVTALSEPESTALASFVQNVHPVFVMSFHSSGGVAVSNDAGNSRALANLYASKSGYAYRNNDTIGTFFDYDTTGAFEDWLNDKQGIGAILVELYSKYDDEFSRNKTAMWTIAQSVSF